MLSMTTQESGMSNLLVIENMDLNCEAPNFGPREPGEYRGYYENGNGGQFVFRRLVEDNIGRLYSSEIGWDLEFEVYHDNENCAYGFNCKSELITQRDGTPLTDPLTHSWINACLCSSGLCAHAAAAHRDPTIADNVGFDDDDCDDDDDGDY